MIHRPVSPWRLRTSCASIVGAPHASTGDDGAARTTQRVSAVLADGVAAVRNTRHATFEARAASVSRRLATRSSARTSPHTSSTTAPSASQASASAAARSAVSASAARTVTSRRGSRPRSWRPLIESPPDSSSVKSCRTHTSGRRPARRCASPAMKPVAAAV